MQATVNGQHTSGNSNFSAKPWKSILGYLSAGQGLLQAGREHREGITEHLP